MIFHILADGAHGNEEVIKKEREVLEKIIKQHESLVFFTEIFKINEADLIHSVLAGDWKNDARKVYEPIISLIRNYNIPLYPLAPVQEKTSANDLNESLFNTFWYHYSLTKPRISVIDIGQNHSSYFISQLKSKEELYGSEIHLHLLTPSLIDEEETRIITI